MALEVADHPVHAQAGVLERQLVGAVAHHALGDVHRHVAFERAGAVQGVEQHARLGGGARAQLDQLDGAGEGGDLRGGGVEDPALGAGRVVLGQLADSVEQLGAAGVVEVLGGQFLEGPGQPVEHVLGERALLGTAEVGVDLDGVVGGGAVCRDSVCRDSVCPASVGARGVGGLSRGSHHASLASRTPAKIWRRSG